MSDADREAWDQRYREGTYRPRPDGSPFLSRWTDHVAALRRASGDVPGRALDIACGTGRNARLLARAGFVVTAVDISPVAVERGRQEAEEAGLEIEFVVADLDTFAVDVRAFDLVSVVRFRDATLWPRLRAGLAPGGWVVVEHHLVTHLDAGGPPTDQFRLRPGELLEAFGDLRVVHYAETVDQPDLPDHVDRPFVTARFAAVDGDPGW